MQPESLTIVTFLAGKLQGTVWAKYLYLGENVLFSLAAVIALSCIAYGASRDTGLIPGRLRNLVEVFVGGADDFVCGVLGPQGRRYLPFIGTLFIYILCMNLFGLVPLLKSPTSSWSTTLALALCVFVYVQYTAVRELGLWGYVDHLMGRPRGILAFSVFIPLMMFILHIVSELVKPLSLSLRLRSNIWGDDMLLGVLTGLGIPCVPLVVFSMLLSVVASVVQAVVFSLLSLIYFTLVLTREE